MAIDDELNDEKFFDLYNKNPQIKNIVDGIQKKYHTHFSQKEQPDYNKANIPIAMKEAKETVEQLLAQQKQGLEAKIAKGFPSIFEGVGKFFSNTPVAATAAALLFLYFGLPAY